MKRIFLFLCLLTAQSCANLGSYQNPWTEYYNQNLINIENMKNLDLEHVTLIANNTTDFNQLLSIIDQAALIRASQQKQYEFASGTSQGLDCLNILQLIGSRSAAIELDIADYLAKKGMKGKAKELYRNVITTYTGNAYRSYVRQAEFSLEDLNDNEME